MISRVCDFNDTVAPHDFIVVKWKLSDNNKVNTAKHATQLLCNRCLTLVDLQAIADSQLANQCKSSETCAEETDLD